MLKEKDLFCNLIYWEDSIGGYRKDLFDALSAYKPVSAYGRFLNNVGGKGVSYKEKFEILRRSKFTIAVEGCNYKGVTTEKIEQPLTHHSIPIYYGNVDITNDYQYTLDKLSNNRQERYVNNNIINDNINILLKIYTGI